MQTRLTQCFITLCLLASVVLVVFFLYELSDYFSPVDRTTSGQSSCNFMPSDTTDTKAPLCPLCSTPAEKITEVSVYLHDYDGVESYWTGNEQFRELVGAGTLKRNHSRKMEFSPVVTVIIVGARTSV